MGTREHYEEGIPSWVDLMSPDVDASKDFYCGLFRWDARDELDDEGNRIYVTFLKDGRSVAGLGGQLPGTEGMPAVWHSYVNTADADATAKRAEAAGGSILMAPMDVMEAGRMAVLQDPSGATISLWQPRQHVGAGLVNGPGLFGWSELMTRDPGGVRSFYEDTFGWQLVDQDMGPGGTYTVATFDGKRSFAGLMQMPEGVPDEVPNYWVVYFGSEDVDRDCEKVEQLGGEVHAEPFDIPGVGRVAAVADPQGGAFQIMAGEQWDD